MHLKISSLIDYSSFSYTQNLSKRIHKFLKTHFHRNTPYSHSKILLKFVCMIAEIKSKNRQFKVDLSQPLDISIPLRAGKENVSAWYVDPIKIEPVRTEQFTGSVKEGGSVNFRNISFNPHGNGTHTECVGHIAKEVYSINQQLKRFFFWAELISIKPKIGRAHV